MGMGNSQTLCFDCTLNQFFNPSTGDRPLVPAALAFVGDESCCSLVLFSEEWRVLFSLAVANELHLFISLSSVGIIVEVGISVNAPCHTQHLSQSLSLPWSLKMPQRHLLQLLVRRKEEDEDTKF